MGEKMQLQELKKAYNTGHFSKELYDKLLQQREAMHEEILHLKEKAFYNQKGPPEKLVKLREALIEIDHRIDALGEKHEEKIDQLRKELIAKILKLHPSSQKEYELLCSQLTTYQHEATTCTALLTKLLSFYEALREGAATKKISGWYSILLGRNSKAVLARAIHRAAQEAQKVREEIEGEMRKFLDIFLEEAHRPWNKSLYQGRFYQLYDEFYHLIKNLEEKQEQSTQKTIAIEEAIEHWIEKYSQAN